MLAFDGAAGKTYAGIAKTTTTAARLREPVNLDARFNAALK